MKTIIAGSRTIEDKEALEHTIAAAGWEITEVVSGTCRGVDVMGEEWGRANGVPVRPFPADWLTHGRTAGELRNREMANYADGLILLWDGKSPGASCMLREANKTGIKVYNQIYGLDMQQLEETEQQIMAYYHAGKGRLINDHGHWRWEYADEGAPRVTQEAVAELIRRDMMQPTMIEVLQVIA